MHQLLLLLLPTLTLAYIQVDLKGEVQENNLTSSEANPKGFVEREITDQDKTTFGIQDYLVKRAIGRINGKTPDEVYLTSKTPFDNLHKRYGFEPVRVRVTPLRQNINIDFSSYTKKISKTKYENPTKRSKNTLINESGHLIKTVLSYWVREDRINGVETKITLSFHTDNDLVEFDNTFPFHLNRRYTDNTYYEANDTIRLDAGQKVTAELEATNGVFWVQIPYKIRLTGDVVAKYTEMYKDKYFHTFDINDVFKESNVNSTRIIKQRLQYEVLYDARIHIRDSNDIIINTIQTESKVGAKGGRKSSKKHEDKTEGVPMTRKKIDFKVPEDETIETLEVHEEESEEQEENQ